MLTYINIKNVAIIKELELDFQPGMTVITGETGAGKSIIVDTLELALGARTDASIIGKNADRAEITAMFDISSYPKIAKWLIDQELDSENDCIIRRTISADGRSKSTINGYPCTQQLIRTLGESLLNIHGQHEYQALLTQEKQRDILDQFAGNQELAKQVQEIYAQWLKAKKDLVEIQNLAENYPEKIEFLSFQLRELENIDLSPESLTALHNEHRLFSNSEQLINNLTSALDLTAESDNAAALSNLYNAKNCLEKFADLDPKIANIVDLFRNAILHTEEATAELRRQIDAIELNQDRYHQVTEQINYLHDLARKHKVDPEQLNAVKDSLLKQHAQLESSITNLKKLTTEVSEREKQYLEVATKLSKKREQAANKFNQILTAKMQTLGMAGGEFAVNFGKNPPEEFSASGLEKIEFHVSANPGFPLQPLHKVASGGELSRISLAIQVIAAENSTTPTLIFDEVDVGIGGKTAEIVGQLLRKLGKSNQVISVTHLPQVAAQGHHHLVVEKSTAKTGTDISIRTLTKQERTPEIARMLGGIKITTQALAHATEMLNSVV